MKWLLLFGGIGVLAAVLYALLGLWLWRRTKALFAEVERATERAELALAPDPEEPARPVDALRPVD